MDQTRERVRKLARDTDIIDWRDEDGDQHVEQMIDSLMVIWREARNQALEDAAHAFEQHNRKNRQWVNGSLWGNLTTEGCARIRALKEEA